MDIIERITNALRAEGVEVRAAHDHEEADMVATFRCGGHGIRSIERHLSEAGFDDVKAYFAGGNAGELPRYWVTLNERSIDDILGDITERAMEMTWNATAQDTALAVGDTVEAAVDITDEMLTPSGADEILSLVVVPLGTRGVITRAQACASPLTLDVCFAGDTNGWWCNPAWLRRIEPGDALPDSMGSEGGAVLSDATLAAMDDEPMTWEHGEGTVIGEVIALAECYRDKWTDKDDAYWFMRLSQEVGELGSSLAGDHDDTPEHELRQIASIAMNWLRKRDVLQAALESVGA